jgi:hypothetical protein
VSDLFKDHKPELSEEEDRLLWQRVRAIPAIDTAPAQRPVPWWERLWAMPGVRYGAPALAVLVAAVIWVIEREPAYKAQPGRVGQESQASRPAAETPPVPMRNTARVTAVDEKVADKPDAGAAMPAKDEADGAGWRADQAAPSETKEAERPPAAPTAAALGKNAPATGPAATTFAAPPPASAPAPAAESRKKSAVAEPQASASKAKDQWGSVKSGYRDSGNSAQLGMMQVLSVPDQLVQGTLPAPAQLADHPLLKAVSGVPYETAIQVPPPSDVSDAVSRQRVRNEVRAGSIGFGDADVPVQAAVIALALERALAAPASVPRTRIEAMLAHAQAIDASANAAEKPGTSRLVAMIEGALRAWP